MVNVITALVSPAASLLLKRNLAHARAVCAIVGQGFLKGYAWQNIVGLVRQMNLETGFGTSPAFVNGNNPFGMGRVYTRPTTQVSWRNSEAGGAYEGETLGQYKTIEDGVKDRIMWDQYQGIQGTESDYLACVARKGFNSAPGYADAVANTAAGSVAGVAALLAIITPVTAWAVAKFIQK